MWSMKYQVPDYIQKCHHPTPSPVFFLISVPPNCAFKSEKERHLCLDTHGAQRHYCHHSDVGCDPSGVCARVPEPWRGHLHIFLSRTHGLCFPGS
jgi:hypothetical protein